MVDANQFFNQETITSGGGEAVSDSINASDEDTLTLQLVGDANSDNLKLQLLASVGNVSGVFGEHSVVSTLDLANSQNQSKLKTFDVEDVSSVKARVVNDGSADATIDGYDARA